MKVSERTKANIIHMKLCEGLPTTEITRHVNLSIYIIRKIIKEYREEVKNGQDR